MQKTPVALLTTLLDYFRPGRSRRSRKRPSGNRSMPPEMQQEVMGRAQEKRQHKMERPQGWYNG